jgi:plasmid maintenance system antidote protein VapI
LIDIERMDDDFLTCAEMANELKDIEAHITYLIPKSSKTTKNVILGIGGALFLFPWFWMDLSNADKQELEAFQARYKLLTNLKADADCAPLVNNDVSF